MARENLIQIETCFGHGHPEAIFHFRSTKPIGATAEPLYAVGYTQKADYHKLIGFDAKNLVAEIFGISGVWKVSTHYQSVSVTIGKAYTLEEIVPRVVAIIATLFYYDENKALDDIMIEYIGNTKPPRVEFHLHETEQARLEIDCIKQM
jgi:hypothetical protein